MVILIPSFVLFPAPFPLAELSSGYGSHLFLFQMCDNVWLDAGLHCYIVECQIIFYILYSISFRSVDFHSDMQLVCFGSGWSFWDLFFFNIFIGV